MRESRLYLNFFQRNLLLFTFFSLLGLMIGFYTQSKQPIIYSLSKSYELNFNSENAQTQLILTDQVVSLLRESSIQKKINLNSQTKLAVYKSGPLLINLTIKSERQQLLSENLTTVEEFLFSQYQFLQIGLPVMEINYPKPYFLAGGLVAGLLIGIFASLIKEYFNNF